AGALGFSTSRSLNHKGSDGRVSPSLQAAEAELTAIATALGQTGTGVLQAISDFDDLDEEMAMLGRVCRASGRPMSISLLQRHATPDQWQDILRWIERFNAEGMKVLAQVSDRPVGALLGLDLSLNPLTRSQAYASVADLPLEARARKLAEPSLKERIVADLARMEPALQFDRMYPLDKSPDYEPTAERFVSALASARGVSPAEELFDLMLEDNGRAVIAQPSSNYAQGSLEVCRQMLAHEHTVIGLADGGAHLGILCDSSQPTHLLSYWTRDRASDRIPVERAVSALTQEPADAVGLGDRGVIAAGKRADINVIDYDKLAFDRPTASYDLPEGGRRLRQRSHGYVATFVSGTAIRRDDEETGARPGRLVRGAR
ncbi:MAG TPA: amidohydrolase family protein, partial [Novosphingobium sp.]|nr:amidohydrolase family protein [Novosphingobium sp.]